MHANTVSVRLPYIPFLSLLPAQKINTLTNEQTDATDDEYE